MDYSEIVQYKEKTVRLTYVNKFGSLNIQTGVIANMSLSLAFFLVLDAEEDIEIPIPFKNIKKIDKINGG